MILALLNRFQRGVRKHLPPGPPSLRGKGEQDKGPCPRSLDWGGVRAHFNNNNTIVTGDFARSA